MIAHWTLRTRLSLILAVTVLSLYPPLLSLRDGGFASIFNYFAADAFYYLAVAKQAATHSVPTFDGIHPTNGFHPFWQAILWMFARVGSVRSEALIGCSFFLSLAFATVGSILFALGTLRTTRSFWLALGAAVPGYFYWIFAVLDPKHYSSWANVNGMESGLSSLFFGGFVLAFSSARSPSTARAVLVGALLLTGVVLARLDDVSFVPPFVLFVALASRGHRARSRNIALAAGVPVLALSIYVLINKSYCGQFLPVSGKMKNEGLVALLRNLGDPVAALFPSFGGLLYGGSSADAWGKSAAKTLALMLPGAGALAFLWCARKKGAPCWGIGSRSQPEALLAVVAAGALCKVAFNFLTVGLWHQGTWYFTTNMMTLQLIVACSLSRILRRQDRRTLFSDKKTGLLLGSFAFALIWIHAGAFGKTLADPGYHERYATFWRERARAEAELTRVSGSSGVLSYDDGIIAFSLSRSVTSGLGFSLDAQAAEAKRRGELLDVAYARGIRVIASVNYFPELDAGLGSDDIRRLLRRTSALKWERLDGWDFEVLELKDVHYGRFVAFSPHEGPPTSAEDGLAAKPGIEGLRGLWQKLRRRILGTALEKAR